jgi:hypothetical protein
MSEPTLPKPTLPEQQLRDQSLLDQSLDDTDRGWGERPSETDPDDLDRFLADRPPHHG